MTISQQKDHSDLSAYNRFFVEDEE